MQTFVKSVFLSESDSRSVHYFISSNPSGADPEKIGFGIEAKLFRGETLLDQDSVPDITCSETEVRSLTDLLSRNCVTPVCLKDVIEDYLAG